MPANSLPSINPQFPYYILLYIMTALVRWTRVYRERPRTGNFAQNKKYWLRCLYFGFELVNVSAGVFILLSQKASVFIATFLVLYVMLVLLANWLESEDVTDLVKTICHAIVITIIVSVTCYTFLGFEGLNESRAPGSDANTMRQWRVAIAFKDSSLTQHVGAKKDAIYVSYVTEVDASSRKEAIQKAQDKFYSADGPRPFNVNTEKTENTMEISERKIVTEAKELQD